MHYDLHPRGGGLLKNTIAAGLCRLGQRRADIEGDREQINRRVPSPRPGEPHYNDSYVFQGTSDDGAMFMSRIGFRGDGSEAELWVFLDVDGTKHIHPETRVSVAAADRQRIAAGALTYDHDALRDQWHVTFEGPTDQGALAKVALTYRPRSAIYLSSAHMDPASTGKAMAEMPWSRDYFRKLRSERQVRMEQGGVLEGTLALDGAARSVRLRAFRDHSFGKRDWRFINRYIWNILALEAPLHIDGAPYEYLCFTTVDYGSSFRHLVTGWIAGPEHLRPIVATSNMHALAASGTIPERYPIVFQPKGTRPFEGEVQRVGAPQPWLLQDGTFEVNEARCTVDIEGIRGVGLSEFGFSNRCGIPRPALQGRAP